MLAFAPAVRVGLRYSGAAGGRLCRVSCGSKRAMTTKTPSMTASPTLLSSAEAAEVDRRLMDPNGVGYKLEQLMELAGLAVAEAVADVADRLGLQRDRALIVSVAGPGNNGGDALVAARHLSLMGFTRVEVVCPVNKFPFLSRQLNAFNVPFVATVDPHAALIIDGVFGFSFRPPLRGPFPELLGQMNDCRAPLVCVDIPSGVDVDTGERCDGALREPHALVSLTAPKRGSRAVQCELHYCGGRFVPPGLASELGLTLPDFSDTASQVVLLR